MRKRNSYKKKEHKPDCVYGRIDMGRFINYLMEKGKKTIAEKALYGALEEIRKKTKEDPVEVFEKAIQKQSELVGEEIALGQAKRAGLGVSPEGRIVNCTGHPQIVLMRLIKFFTAGGNLLALVECTPLINQMIKDFPPEEANLTKNQKEEKRPETV